jgi:hypothetical protein
MSFLNIQSNNNQYSTKNGDSTMITKDKSSKTTSQYEVKCKNCMRVFDTVDKFLIHKSNCGSMVEVAYEE